MKSTIIDFFLSIFEHIDQINNKIFLKKIQNIAKLNSISLVDIGSSYDIQPRWKKIKRILNYHGFEPNIKLHDDLKNKNNDCLSYNVYPYLISNEKKKIELNLCENPGVSSIYKPNYNFLSKFKNYKRFEVIKKINLESNYLDNIKIKYTDFIKIDIQGAELNALNGSVETLKGTIGLEIEVEFQKMYEKQPLFGEINQFLCEQEFEFIDFPLMKRWERKKINSYGQLIFADALFLRTPEYANRNYDTFKMSKYILILLLYNKFDLIDECNLEHFYDNKELEKIIKTISFFKKKNNIARFINSISTGFSKILGNEYKSHLFN